MQRQLTPLALSLALAFAGAAHAAPDDKDKPDLRATYTKYEFRIPMRDGVRLFTAIPS
jgi:predicted acyl esterase